MVVEIKNLSLTCYSLEMLYRNLKFGERSGLEIQLWEWSV